MTMSNEMRVEKKIGKLTSQLFFVSGDERGRLLRRIEKLRERLKSKDRWSQTIRIPDEAFRHREKYVL